MDQVLPSFETLLKMAKQDPEALERVRQQHIDKAISNAPEGYRQRLSGLQFQIDGIRRTSKSPMSACINISKMMHDSLHTLKTYIDESETPEILEPSEAATVLAFPS